MQTFRFTAVENANAKEPVVAVAPESETSAYYGRNVFNRAAMRRYLSEETRRSIYETVERGATLDRNVANHVAEGMKRWAMDLGATHYTHWFQPLTGGTAEKHDSFADPRGHGESLEKFEGKLLFQQEPDASSFPSGGLRNTFEARGYTAWDPSSPAFVIGDTLCIPTVFVSYTGEALDYKTPLLKSDSAVTKAAREVLEYFGEGDEVIHSYLGWEQEYFLVDKDLYMQRPDLVLTDRTLIGHDSARNQQLDDHYFAAIPPRVLEFMKDLEFEAYKLGIPVKTRHNEVAPNQFEIAPVYEAANLAIDHNLLLMSIMKNVAEKHGFEVLLHEKPFAGINGSGKHCNWSLGTESGIGLMSPGKTDEENLRFLCFMANTLKAVYDNNALLKATVLNATNAHRLGANEAPPAIISSFLGKQVSDAFAQLLASKDMVKITGKKGYSLGIPQIPELLVDNTDRNRTSPFAFTGNRFEFRAVGSSANCSGPITVLNTILAYQLEQFKKAVDRKIKSGTPVMQAVLDETRDTFRACQNICFDGNGYSDEWKAEAQKRGLDCESSVPLTYDAFTSKQTLKVFEETKVMTEVELDSRKEVFWEIYCKKMAIEGKVLSDLTTNHVIPVAIRYQNILLDNVRNLKDIYGDKDFRKMAASQMDLIKCISEDISAAESLVDELDALDAKLSNEEEGRAAAILYHDKMAPMLEEIRSHVDSLEMMVDDQMWPLPKYRELLFIH
ncbi:glutamine synthetase III family protein [Methanomethylophilus alvi]|jgi:glutamine synthetase|uniref:glutamine synthetase III family protein n=1 Tax=Methanomethylophilus alvi TaxID=1291540 RepID=UPI00033F9D7C|nr:glutamine synthetase type III [Methanomethylophilus alvi]MDY7060420.1 glutamine synthetase type III [Methanomethylophilus alvi]CDF30772.1 glutamine synthetase type III [Methanoculleus sp. CAG:1088]